MPGVHPAVTWVAGAATGRSRRPLRWDGMGTPAAPPPAPLGALRRTVRELGLALIALGVAILLFVAYQLLGTNLTEAHDQAALRRAFAAAVAQHRGGPQPAPATAPTTTPTTAPTGSTPPGGADTPVLGAALPSAPTASGVVDHLVIPRIGVDKYVVDGTGEGDLMRGPGHYAGTPYPGQAGDVAIAGHRTTYGAPFYRLDQLRVGDDILLTDTTGTTYRYQVAQAPFVVAPSDVAVIGATGDPTLTLTTCNPRFSATSRLIVKARLVGLPRPVPPAPAATARPAATAAAAPVHHDLTGGSAGARPGAIGWGVAVVVLWVLTRVAVARTRRWARAGALAGGIAVCCVPLWLCFEQVVQLLPQSI